MTDSNPTSAARYGWCGGWDEIKNVTADGVVQAHNHYRSSGTTVVALRCPGSGSSPVDLPPDELSA
jgi:hypothetical protein